MHNLSRYFGLRLSGISAALAVSLVLLWGIAREDEFCKLPQLGRLQLREVAAANFVNTSEVLDVEVDIAAKVFYVVDRGHKKVAKLAWQGNAPETWVQLDPSKCSSPLQSVEVMHLLRKVPRLVLLYCNTLVVLDPVKLSPIWSLESTQDEWVYSFALSPDERFLAVVSRNEGEKQDRVRVLRTADWTVYSEWRARVSGLQFAPSGDYLVTTFSRNVSPTALRATECGVTFLRIFSGEKESEWSREVRNPPCPESLFAFVPGGSWRFVSKNFHQGGVALWEAKTGQLAKGLTANTYRVPQWLSLSSDGHFVAADLVWPEGNNQPKYDLAIWDVETGEIVYQVLSSRCRDNVLVVDFSPEGNYLALIRRNRIELYEYQLSRESDPD